MFTDGDMAPSDSEPPSDAESVEDEENAQGNSGRVSPRVALRAFKRARTLDREPLSSSEDEFDSASDAESDFSLIAPSISSRASSSSEIPMSDFSDTESRWDLMDSTSERSISPGPSGHFESDT